jgi:hypothetical protein
LTYSNHIQKTMKNLSIILMALMFATIGGSVLAKKRQKTEVQKKKTEIKTWKKRKATMQPLQFKELIEENRRLKANNSELSEEIKVSKEALENLIKLKTRLEPRSSEQRIHEETRSQADAYGYWAQGPDGFSRRDWAIDQDGKFYIKGLLFKVQIGAYTKRDLGKTIESEKPQEVFEQEQSEGVNMYTLRRFRDYWQANQFKQELRAMGLKDAWIVAFKDGKRVPLKDVLQDIIKEKG